MITEEFIRVKKLILESSHALVLVHAFERFDTYYDQGTQGKIKKKHLVKTI